MIKDSQIIQIYCGAFHSFFFKSNGEIWGFGINEKGELGIGNIKNQNKPILIMKDEQIEMINGKRINLFEWNPENHKFFTSSFQETILTFLLFLKRNQLLKFVKQPPPEGEFKSLSIYLDQRILKDFSLEYQLTSERKQFNKTRSMQSSFKEY